MLSIMRRQAGSWIIKALLFAIVVVFVFWGVGSFRNRGSNRVADINGEIITYDVYHQAYERLREQYRRVYGNSFDEQMLKAMNLEQQALDQIIQRVLMLQEAKRLNIQATDEILDETIAKIPAFQKNGVFDEAQAEYVLSQNRMTTAEFRNSMREGMIIEKLQALVVNGILATKAEAKEWYDWYNAEADLNYLLFTNQRHKDITLSDDEIAEYFKANENNYLTEPEVKVNYLFFDPLTYKDQIKVSQEDIDTYYQRHQEEFKSEKTVEARHILLKLDANADEKTVAARKLEAEKIYKLAIEGKPFDELAKKYSEDSTKDQGGYLGAFKKDAMVKPFADKAFAMKAGEISEPIRTRFGWHVIKVEKVNEATTQSLEQASNSIRAKLIAEKAKAMAKEKADEIYNSVNEGDDLAAVAQSHQLNIKTTDFFTARNFKEQGISDGKAFADTAFGLKKMSISDTVDLGNGYALLQVVDRREASIPPLETIKEKVRADLSQKRQKEMAKADAEACLAELKKGKSLEEEATAYDLKPLSTGFFKRSGSIPGIGYDPQVSQAVFTLNDSNKLPDKVYEGKQGWYVIQLKARRPPEAEGFEKESGAIITRLTEQKKQATTQEWIRDLKAKGKIEINTKMIK